MDVGSVSRFIIILVNILLCVRCKRKFSSVNSVVFWKISKNAQKVEDFIRNNGSLALKRFNYSDIKRTTGAFNDKLSQGKFRQPGPPGTHLAPPLDDRLVAVKVMTDSKGDGKDFIQRRI
ncbi:hypothetical protein GIB67_018117 [Kingdonia uniflora]|uniref:Uncharacterized protein n=1 Tax=Kingdonia uniflora TaxID=39325 RepID=A0A7J7NWX1_9MAGN|nr:hypothetical protein GIB67_018117 [Kingdonia uniflora]